MPGSSMRGTGSSAQLEEALTAALRLLRRRRIRHMVMGGLALSIWGRVRVTQDLDLAVAVNPTDEPALLRDLQRARFLATTPRNLPGHRLLVCRYLKSSRGLPVQVDLFLVRGPYQMQAISRAVEVKLGRQKAGVITAEDMILYKLIADRPLDRVDARAVIEEQGRRLDREYLRRWARSLGLSKRMSALLRTAT